MTLDDTIEAPLIAHPCDHDELPLTDDSFFGLSPLHWAWTWLHSFSFLLGGTTFIAGTAVLYLPSFAWFGQAYDWWSALLYTVG